MSLLYLGLFCWACIFVLYAFFPAKYTDVCMCTRKLQILISKQLTFSGDDSQLSVTVLDFFFQSHHGIYLNSMILQIFDALWFMHLDVDYESFETEWHQWYISHSLHAFLCCMWRQNGISVIRVIISWESLFPLQMVRITLKMKPFIPFQTPWSLNFWCAKQCLAALAFFGWRRLDDV